MSLWQGNWEYLNNFLLIILLYFFHLNKICNIESPNLIARQAIIDEAITRIQQRAKQPPPGRLLPDNKGEMISAGVNYLDSFGCFGNIKLAPSVSPQTTVTFGRFSEVWSRYTHFSITGSNRMELPGQMIMSRIHCALSFPKQFHLDFVDGGDAQCVMRLL